MSIKDRKRFRLYQAHWKHLFNLSVRLHVSPRQVSGSRYADFLRSKGSEYQLLMTLALAEQSQSDLTLFLKDDRDEARSLPLIVVPLSPVETRLILALTESVAGDEYEVAYQLEHDPWVQRLLERTRRMMDACECAHAPRTRRVRSSHNSECVWWKLSEEVKATIDYVHHRSIDLVDP